jgi:hypothetical protein
LALGWNGSKLLVENENELHMDLKHEAFCQHFVASGNSAAAARSVGYLNHPAKRGSDLLRRVDVQVRVEELMRDRPSLPTRLARRLDAETLHRAAQAISFLSSLV